MRHVWPVSPLTVRCWQIRQIKRLRQFRSIKLHPETFTSHSAVDHMKEFASLASFILLRNIFIFLQTFNCFCTEKLQDFFSNWFVFSYKAYLAGFILNLCRCVLGVFWPEARRMLSTDISDYCNAIAHCPWALHYHGSVVSSHYRRNSIDLIKLQQMNSTPQAPLTSDRENTSTRDLNMVHKKKKKTIWTFLKILTRINNLQHEIRWQI